MADERFGRGMLSGTPFVPFNFVIPNRLQPMRDLLFSLVAERRFGESHGGVRDSRSLHSPAEAGSVGMTLYMD
jgi:hypothetical protein